MQGYNKFISSIGYRIKLFNNICIKTKLNDLINVHKGICEAVIINKKI